MLRKKTSKIKPHFHKGRFYNNPQECHWSHIVPSLDLLLECYWKSLKKSENSNHLSSPVVPSSYSHEPVLTWIGHSTFLIQIAGVNILTDPIFGDLTFLFKRLMTPGIALNDLPTIDYVLISHNHLDHMDSAALHFLRDHTNARYLVPQGNKAWFDKRGFSNVREYTWWNQTKFKHQAGPFTFTFLPAHHWSQRGLFDFNKTLWGSWMISVGDHHIYFAGDTAYSDHFKIINHYFPSISCALMPIAPCEPAKWMGKTHMNAEEAGQAFLDLQATTFVPMHWGTFSFGTDNIEAPLERTVRWWKQQNIGNDKYLAILKAGQRYTMPTALPLQEKPVILPTENIL